MGHTLRRAAMSCLLLRRRAAARIAAAPVALAILAALLAPGAAAQTAGISIPDAGLRSAIESALGRQPGDAITEGDMALVGVLDAGYAGITNLDGLQHAVNLRALYLQGNSISDASSLAGLARMQVLLLHGNDIADIDLTAMTDLRFVDLSYNDLTTIDLSGQRTTVGENARSSMLYALWLNNNRLTSVDVSGLTALRDRPDGTSHPNYVSLRLDRNQLTSVTGLADLPRQVWSLRLEHNQQ
ncbi:MAG: leucine-rich repeat domain-containing protein, partial [Acidimicrobiaceae bacterium]|nr:leucine-rich repeat domain-containing protein [Acidimicrobiaceae bacterium]